MSFKPEGLSGEHLIHSRDLDETAKALTNDTFAGDQYCRDLNEDEAAVYEIRLPEDALISGILEIRVSLCSEDTDKDNLMVTAILMDEMKDGSAFEAYMINEDFSDRVPVKTIGSYEFGEGHDKGKIREFVKSYTYCKAFAYGWMDLLYPEAEKNPTLDTKWHTARKGEYSDYKIIMTPCEYKLEEGHVLKLYLFAQDPVRSRRDDSKDGGLDLAKKDEVYSFKIENASVEVYLPLR